MKKLKNLVLGMGLALGLASGTSALFPKFIEARANTDEVMQVCKEEVKRNTRNQIYQSLDRSIVGLANKVPSDSINNRYELAKKRIASNVNLYLDSAFEQDVFKIAINGNSSTPIYSINRFNPTNYTAQLRYQGNTIASFLIGKGENGEYTANHIHVRPGNKLERDIESIVRTELLNKTISGVEEKFRDGYKSLKTLF